MGPERTTIAPPSEPSRHKCLIYDGDPSEQLPVVIPFLLAGLRGNWRCLYLGSPEMVQMIEAALGDHGVDVRKQERHGALVLSEERLEDGAQFEPQAMIEMLGAMVDGAVRDGFEGLHATGDMAWELGSPENFARVVEYEALLEELFRHKRLRGICQYCRTLVPGHAVPDALSTHQSAYIGRHLNRHNLFYIPPELRANDNGSKAEKQGEWMCQQILRVLEAEDKRDHALNALRESEERLRKLSADLAEMNWHLEQRVRERTTDLEVANQQLEAFSYSVSHDLRSPLQSILGFGEMLAKENAEKLGEDGRRRLGRVLTGARQMNELIDGLLALAGVTKARLESVPVDLSQIAEEVMREIREGEPLRNCEVEILKGMHVFGDRALLRDVLANLIGNAWKFTSKTDRTKIAIGEKSNQEGDRVFFVKDNGAGFEMRDAEKLFGTFQRLHREEEFPGQGIGLATVHRIIARHGGRIWAESQPNQGATFFFTLADNR